MALPSFLTIYNELISTPTISNVTNEKLDYCNKPLIDKLATWFTDLGFSVELQAVPNTRDKFNMLATYSPPTKKLPWQALHFSLSKQN